MYYIQLYEDFLLITLHIFGDVVFKNLAQSIKKSNFINNIPFKSNK